MAPFLIVVLSLQLFQTITWAKVDSSTQYDLNSLHENFPDFSLNPTNELTFESDNFSDDNDKPQTYAGTEDAPSTTDSDTMPIIKSFDDTTEIQFRQPIAWVNVDQLRNAIILKFQSSNTNYLNTMDPEELKRLQVLHNNSIRFGKRSYDANGYSSSTSAYPASGGRNEAFLDKNMGMRAERSHPVVRDSRGDNFMRFGRSVDADGNGGSKDFMRFGRSGGGSDFIRFGRAAGQDFLRFGRAPGQDFMRFGRDPGQDFMRFGRAPGQDFIRFGRAPGQDFMRFGRSPGQDFMRFGRAPGQDFIRFGRSPAQDFMRFGRSPGQDFMRFGRSPGKDFMRFGRNPGQDFMRFGRSQGQDFMRFGRAPGQNFIRFGRAPPTQDFMRFGRNSYKDVTENTMARYSRPDNFMRFGRTPPQSSDFMRFGKSLEKSENHTTSPSPMGKNELKQAVKLIHEADKSADSADNPVDKAIKVLFDKHQEQERMHNDPDSTQHEDSDDQNMDMDYFLKNLK